MLVDARNVLRSRWPNLGGDWFLDRVRTWAERERVAVLAVFDGQAPDGVLGEAQVDERTTVVGTGERSADDWIAEHVAAAGAARPLWLVSSDRGLRARVEPVVARTIGGGSFAGALESLGPG